MPINHESPSYLEEKEESNLTFPEKPLPPEYETLLLELEQKIKNLAGFLMATFFRDDTWLVRQAGAYGFPLLELPEGQKRDEDKEEKLTRQIAEELGDRLAYYEAAYHFPDTLWALRIYCTEEWLKMKIEQSKKSQSEVAEEIFWHVVEKIALEGNKFRKFLASDSFKKAFTINLDYQTGEYQITDLELDSKELEMAWNKLLA